MCCLLPIVGSALTLCLLGNVNSYFFSKSTFRKILSGIQSESYSLDPEQAQHFVLPDVGPNCSQRLSAEDTSR